MIELYQFTKAYTTLFTIMHKHKLVRHADSLEDNVGREYGSRVTDLQSQLNGGQTTREVGHEWGSDNDRDHPHV